MLRDANEHRSRILNVATLAIADTVGAMELLKERPVVDIASQLRSTLPTIAQTYGVVSGQLAVDFYQKRRALAQAPGKFEPIPVLTDVEDIVQAGIGFGIAQIVKGVEYDKVVSTLAGTVQRAVAGVDRKTIEYNSGIDPHAVYQRVAMPDACGFCLMMAAVVDKTWQADAKHFHNSCHCVNLPVFDGERIQRPEYYDTFMTSYDAASKALEAKRADANYYSIKRNKRPKELAFTAPNILREIRANGGYR